MSRNSDFVHQSGGCSFSFVPCLPEPERVLGLGFRQWYSGYVDGDVGAWEQAWCTLSKSLGIENGRVALDDLSRWVRSVRDGAARDIDIFPRNCRSFCRDECVAVAMIAAAQHCRYRAMRVCAFALLGSPMIENVVSNADRLAATLRRCNIVLSPASVVAVDIPSERVKVH